MNVLNPEYMIPTAIGLVSGVGFVTALWLTVRRINQQRHPALLLLISSAARIGVLLGFLWLTVDSSRSAVLFLLGFTVSRIVSVRCIVRTNPMRSFETWGAPS